MSETVQCSDGTMLPLDSVALVFTYLGSNVSTISATYAGSTYVQTFTYVGNNVTNISNWVKTP